MIAATGVAELLQKWHRRGRHGRDVGVCMLCGRVLVAAEASISYL